MGALAFFAREGAHAEARFSVERLMLLKKPHDGLPRLWLVCHACCCAGERLLPYHTYCDRIPPTRLGAVQKPACCITVIAALRSGVVLKHSKGLLVRERTLPWLIDLG